MTTAVTGEYLPKHCTHVFYTLFHCSDVQYIDVQCSDVQYSDVQYSDVQYSDVQCSWLACQQVLMSKPSGSRW